VQRSQGCRNHGCSGCKCTPCLLHFQLCGYSAGADYGCNGCTKLLQQTELNVARGSVWGCSTPHSSGIRQSCYPFGERCDGKHYLWNFWREITEELWLNNCIRSEKNWWREGRSTRIECRIMTPFHFHWCPFVKEYALLLTNCTPCPQQLPASLSALTN
jgi:hypothetical protein